MVKFLGEDNKYHKGIGYHDKLIFPDGSITDINRYILDYNAKTGIFWDDIVIEIKWINFDF